MDPLFSAKLTLSVLFIIFKNLYYFSYNLIFSLTKNKKQKK